MGFLITAVICITICEIVEETCEYFKYKKDKETE